MVRDQPPDEQPDGPDEPPGEAQQQLPLFGPSPARPGGTVIEIQDRTEYVELVEQAWDEVKGPVTADFLRARVGLPRVRNWAGLTVASAARRGVIREIGYGRSAARSRHGGTVRLWEVVAAEPIDDEAEPA
jgi:hypothetical protein